MTDLASKKCIPCEEGTEPFTRAQAEEYLKHISDWQLSDDAKSISHNFKFKNFAQALAFVNKIGEIAESEGHHPDIELGWGYVNIKSTTHAIKGLSENDFILAAKIDKI